MGSIKLIDITKYFPENGVTANARVDLHIREGEIHAIVGENGSGKSTLMHVLSGLIRPDTGKILLDEISLRINSPHEALEFGIGMVHQHVQIVREFSVLQNIILGREPRTWWGRIETDRARLQVQSLMDTYNLQLELDRPAFELSIDGEQKIALLALLYAGARYIILDEPTTLFEEDETDLLHAVLEKLRSRGITLVLITHKLREALHYADRVSVMRAGRRITTKSTGELTQEELSRLMIGPSTRWDGSASRTVYTNSPGHSTRSAAPVLQLQEVEYRHSLSSSALPEVKGVSFDLFPGEALAITGIRENGLETLEQILSGFTPPSSGRILFKDESIRGLSIRDLRRKQIAYIPTERILRGASLGSSVEENMILLNYRDFHGWGRLKREEIQHFAGNLKQLFNIKASPKDRLAGLSGGNIQKVIISRELVNSPELLIFSEPSWGLDFAGRRFVLQKIEELKAHGSAVLVITSDIEEALECADRIVVMYRGRISGILRSDQVDKSRIGRLMLGVESYA
jgi:general nucleoside transport system ATP-binding protein